MIAASSRRGGLAESEARSALQQPHTAVGACHTRVLLGRRMHLCVTAHTHTEPGHTHRASSHTHRARSHTHRFSSHTHRASSHRGWSVSQSVQLIGVVTGHGQVKGGEGHFPEHCSQANWLAASSWRARGSHGGVRAYGPTSLQASLDPLTDTGFHSSLPRFPACSFSSPVICLALRDHRVSGNSHPGYLRPVGDSTRVFFGKLLHPSSPANSTPG